ncbi:MAG: DUF4258 domain-containing protein [Chloroflexi bacterium]|nr:DUF4258 domain-containing protein [Chloroflexota bacterium]
MKRAVKINVKLSIHAKEKMQSRGIKKADISAAIKEPDSIYDDLEHGTLIAVKKINGNSIIVAYRIESNGAKVITLFYTTKLDKLIRAKVARGAWKKQK